MQSQKATGNLTSVKRFTELIYLFCVNAAYEPATQKKVPKYFTPTATSEMLIAKPKRHMRRPTKMNGERKLMASDHMAMMYRQIAG